MSLFTKSENWSLFALAGSLVLAYAMCFAPGHRHLFGDPSDPMSTTLELFMAAAVIVEVVVLFTMPRRRQD